jgi:putative inorganic carbon (HCO3(-)) transporter
MGILHHIKLLAPGIFYLTGLILFLMGFQRKGHWPLLMATLIIPLRNIVDRIQDFPLGNQFIDILIGGAIVSWLLTRMVQKEGLLAPSSLNAIIIVMVCYTFFSLLQGSDYLYGNFSLSLSDNRVKDWKNFCLMPLLFFVTLNLIKDRKWIIYIMLAMLAAMVMMDYYTIIQIHNYPSLESREKITGTFQFLGPNEVAAFFNEYTVILLAIIFCLKVKRTRLLLLGVVCLNIFCIIFLYSRGAYLGLGLGLFFLFLLKSKKLLVPLILALIFWQAVLPEKAVERVKSTKNEYGQLDESSERRVLIWQQAFDLFKKNPITGIGFNVFGYLGLDLGDTHNIYVKFLVEQGIVGLIIFLIVVFCFFKMGYTLYQKGEDDLAKGMGLGLMACILVLMVNNLFGNRWVYFELSSYLWIFAGLVGRMIILDSKPDRLSSSKSESSIQGNAGKETPPTPPKKKKVRYYDI